MERILVAISCFVLVTACGGDKKSDSHQNPPGWEVTNVQVSPDVILVPDDMDVVVTATSLQVSAADAARLGPVREGTILVCGRDMGFLRLVSSISEVADDVVYQTVNASLAETLVSADISGSIPMDFLDEAQQRNKDGTFGVDRAGFQLYTGGADVSLSQAGFSFTPSLDLDLSFHGGALEHFRLEVAGQIDAALAAQLTASAGGSYNNYVTLWESSPVTTTVWAGWVPIVLVTRLTLDAGFGLSLDGGATVEAGASMSSSVSLGAEYVNGTWQPIVSDSFSVEAIGPTLELNAGANLRVYLRPKVEVKLYDVAGPSVTLEPYGRFAATLTPPPPGWELSAGITSVLSVRVEVFDKTFASWSTTLFDKNWPLASGTFAGCTDNDGDSRDGYDVEVCPAGEDHCDDDPNNWTTLGCADCVDSDGDGYGVDCDKGDDCDDMDGTLHSGCTVCGNGTIEAGEDCDDGNATAGDGCSDTCQLEVPPGCGNGVREHGEACDDGNTVDCDGCSAQCVVEACGNFTQECGEACDDGNQTSGDGCSDTCTVEVSGVCGDGVLHPAEACDDGNLAVGDGCSDTCTVETAGVCGDGQVHPAEGCDDGNVVDCDGCSAQCVVEGCGNGVPECAEECDDGNTTAGDGCGATCLLEVAPGCGNGVLEQGEACDDGNTADGDGCSGACQSETPTDCGNGAVDPGEDCDDGNVVNGDGCSAQCQVEVPGVCQTDYVLGCGDLHAHNNGGPGSTQHIHTYSCSGLSETGPEYAYTFTAPVSGQATVTLSEMTADLDVFVLDETGTPCDAANSCLDYGDTEVSWSTTAGSVYYIVVDGYQGAVSDYEIVLTCGACGDGTVDPSEECDDGNTVDGDGCSAGCLFEVAGSCSPAEPIGCGDVVSGNNGAAGSTTNIDMYGCGGWVETGPEYAYTFTPQTTQTVTVTKTFSTAQVDIYVLEDWGTGCAAEDCVDYHDVAVNFTAIAGTTYYIVMDGYLGDVGDYTIQVTCN